jgi:hypothetical protein
LSVYNSSQHFSHLIRLLTNIFNLQCASGGSVDLGGGFSGRHFGGVVGNEAQMRGPERCGKSKSFHSLTLKVKGCSYISTILKYDFLFALSHWTTKHEGKFDLGRRNSASEVRCG